MTCRLIAVAMSLTAGLHAAVFGADPVLWTFSDQHVPQGTRHGAADFVAGDLRAPTYPDFADDNVVLQLEAPSWIEIPDEGTDTRFDFDNGDAVTFEAWVRVDSLGENMCLIGKGRTGRSGPESVNQNWAFRLRRVNGEARVNFLFRSRPSGDHKGDWHRWTSSRGFVSGRWHHVALSYEFGKPDSIRGYIDGRSTSGKWDLGGATTQSPVVDDDSVWIGSTMGGLRNNSFDGAIDNLAIHRRIVSSEELKTRFRWTPPPIAAPVIPPGQVVVQLFNHTGSVSEISSETLTPLTEWHQEELGFVRMPHRYDAWGVREDWGQTLLVRAWMDLQVPAGEYQLMSRSRGLSRLTIDGDVVLKTRPQKNRAGAHHVVDELPKVPFPGMRPHAMNDDEVIVPFESDGKSHRLMYEVIVGGPKYRAEFGETSLSIASPESMFHIVSAVSKYPLTDAGWLAFRDDAEAKLSRLDDETRAAANQKKAGFWQKRHQHARETLLSDRPSTGIDDLIAERLAAVNRSAADGPSAAADADGFYASKVQPILDAHCTRCHGQKEQGGLLVVDRARLLEGGESGEPAVVPGHPDDSYLFQLVTADPDDYRMPPKGDGLTADEIDVLRQWITDGVPMPEYRPQSIRQIPVVDDHRFLRRVFIDTVGVPPTLQEAELFLTDPSVDRRDRLVNRLLQDDRWADNWTGYWQDVLAENPNLLKPTLNNTGPFRYWIHEALKDNKSIDRFATELILMRGSTWGGGAAGFAVASQNDVPMAAKAHVIGSAFLGVNMKCARCHDAPYHAWKQSDLFQMAAMLDRHALKLPESSTVPAAFFEKQERRSLIDVSLKPGATVEAGFPFAELAPLVTAELLERPRDTREQLAVQVTASRRFAEVVANRIWKRLMGAGIVEPVDDWEGNPPSDPDLLASLADSLILCDYDLKAFTREILTSDVYQREAADLPDHRERFFANPYRRRMSAEQIVDSAFHVVGQRMQTEQLTLDVEGTLPASKFLNFGFPQRAWEFTTLANERDRPSLALPRVQAIADVLKVFGWRNSRPEPETDREEEPNLIQPAVLANGTLGVWLTRLSDSSGITELAMQDQPVEELVDSLFLQMLTRPPSAEERKNFVQLLTPGYADRITNRQVAASASGIPRFPYVSWSNHLNTEANRIKIEMQERVRQGPTPTARLSDDWRRRAEDAVWSLLNTPEMILVP